ncbi:MAG: hypothetical protein ABII00_19215 [Elusimicrobiota bacterium]
MAAPPLVRGAEPPAAAVSSGKMVLVAIETGRFWNDVDSKKGSHVIVITGTEINRWTGQALSYYVNDSGTDEAARLVPRAQFLKAWQARGSRMVEVM